MQHDQVLLPANHMRLHYMLAAYQHQMMHHFAICIYPFSLALVSPPATTALADVIIFICKWAHVHRCPPPSVFSHLFLILFFDVQEEGQGHELQGSQICHWMAFLWPYKTVVKGGFILNRFCEVQQRHTDEHTHRDAHTDKPTLTKGDHAKCCILPQNKMLHFISMPTTLKFI